MDFVQRRNVVEENQNALDIDIVCPDRDYLPIFATLGDFCMDLKARILQDKTNSITIEPGDWVAVGTGIQVKVPLGWGMVIVPRSSTGVKLHCELENTVGIIDAGYRDEIKLIIRNKGNVPVTIENKQRICQMVLLQRPFVNWNIVKDDDYFRGGDRGGGFGSTGV